MVFKAALGDEFGRVHLWTSQIDGPMIQLGVVENQRIVRMWH